MKILRYGGDCSGLDAPILALKKLDINFKYVFTSEINDKLRNNIIKQYNPKLVFNDITKRNHTKLPIIDLYISGFPCQSFSSTNRIRKGFNSDQGIIFFHCYETIKQTKPKYFILENVKGLITHEKGETLQVIKKYLAKLKDYTVYYEVINSKYFTPQDRDRIYIIGVKNIKKKINFHSYPNKEKHILDIIDKKNKNQNILSPIKQKLLKEVIDKKKINIKDCWIVNLNTSCINYATSRKNLSPTILTSSQMYYIIPFKRFLTMNELQKLQGFNNFNIDFLNKTEQYRSIGNTMTVNVIAYILKTLFNNN